MHVRRMRRARECTLVTRGGRFTAHARRETARGMLGSTTGRSMLIVNGGNYIGTSKDALGEFMIDLAKMRRPAVQVSA